jgi:hypothetical protein
MTKAKIKQIILENIQLFIEDNREEILDAISVECVDTDEDNEVVPVELDVIEEVYDQVLDNLF